MAEHLSQSYVARELGVSRQAINQLVARNKIPTVEGSNKIPRSWLESEESNRYKHSVTKIPMETLSEIQGHFGGSEDGEDHGV